MFFFQKMTYLLQTQILKGQCQNDKLSKTFKYSDLLINVSWNRKLQLAIGKLWSIKSNQKESLTLIYLSFFIEALLHGIAHNGSFCSDAPSALLQVKAGRWSSNHFRHYGFGIFSTPCFTLSPSPPLTTPTSCSSEDLVFFKSSPRTVVLNAESTPAHKILIQLLTPFIHFCGSFIPLNELN